MKNKITISIVTILILMQAIPVSVSAALPRVPIQLDGEGLLGGLTSGTTNAASSSCQAADTITEQVQSVLSQGLNFLGESPLLVTNLQAELTRVSGAITCWVGVANGGSFSNSLTGNTLFGFTKSNATKEQALVQIASLKQTRKQIEARIQVASQGFWKAVLVGILLKQTDQITERLTNQLTEKFKIRDYAKYITALSDTVYTNQAILSTVTDKRDQAIVRSMITNPILRSKIHPAIEAAANAYVGFDSKSLNFEDPQFINKIAKLNEGISYKTLYQERMITKVDEVITKARAAAAAEVQQGGGYKSALNNCGPSISQQKQKDKEYQAILDEIQNRVELRDQIIQAPGAANAGSSPIGTTSTMPDYIQSGPADAGSGTIVPTPTSTAPTIQPGITPNAGGSLSPTSFLKKIFGKSAHAAGLPTTTSTTPAPTGSASSAPTDLLKVTSDINTATSKLSKFTESFGSAVFQICDGINTPALKFKDTIHDLIGSQIKNFSDYNDNNLPFFQKLVVNIGNTLINKFVFGQNVSTSEIINEATRTVSGSIAGSLPSPSPAPVPPTIPTSPPNPAPTQSGKAINAEALGNGSYRITINLVSLTQAVRFSLSGPNIGGFNENEIQSQNVTGSYTFNSSAGAKYTLLAYNSNGDIVLNDSVILQEGVTITPPILNPQVNGASTGPVLPRGPMPAPR